MALPRTVIRFTDIEKQDKGSITYEDGKLTASDPGNQIVADEWIEFGGTAESFVEKYSDYTNGREWAKAE